SLFRSLVVICTRAWGLVPFRRIRARYLPLRTPARGGTHSGRAAGARRPPLFDREPRPGRVQGRASRRGVGRPFRERGGDHHGAPDRPHGDRGHRQGAAADPHRVPSRLPVHRDGRADGGRAPAGGRPGGRPEERPDVPLPARLAVSSGLGFAGRERERTVLADAWKDVIASGRRRVVLVSGEAGIGKTTLCSVFAAETHREAVVLYGRCDEEPAIPYQPWREVLTGLGRGAPDVVAGRR